MAVGLDVESPSASTPVYLTPSTFESYTDPKDHRFGGAQSPFGILAPAACISPSSLDHRYHLSPGYLWSFCSWIASPPMLYLPIPGDCYSIELFLLSDVWGDPGLDHILICHLVSPWTNILDICGQGVWVAVVGSWEESKVSPVEGKSGHQTKLRYLGIHLTKDVKDFNWVNYKTLKKTDRAAAAIPGASLEWHDT